MRFRLRTLLIVIAVLAAVLARLAYLKRQRDFHRQEVNRLVTQLAAFHHYDWREIERRVRDIAADGPNVRGSWVGADLPREYGRAEYEDWLTNWHLARQHEILANRFSRAIYRPWAMVWDDPNSVPGKVRWVDLRVATYSAILALALFAAWRWWPKTIVIPKTATDYQEA
jgi:hypothetical protein